MSSVVPLLPTRNTRPLTVADAPALAALHSACLPPGWSATSFTQSLEDTTVRGEGMFSITGEVVAFILYRALTDEFEILTLAVDEAHRGHGLATELLKHMEQEAKGAAATILFLEVAADNLGAYVLYSKQGYMEYGRRKGYYARDLSPVDAILMRKSLSGAAIH